jgi:FtsP/CotA-like multicopper oxidase with cupredoxin domain
MKRREFMRYGIGGMAVLGGVTTGLLAGFQKRAMSAGARTVDIALSIVDSTIRMIDSTDVYMWAFSDGSGPRVPGAVIQVLEGDTVSLSVTNSLPGEHGFAIAGIPGSNTGVIESGGTRSVTFQAPAPGTYLYLDPLNAPVNRVLGLHGAFVVLPASVGTPYGSRVDAVGRLFGDLGKAGVFPGKPWDPARTQVWVFNDIDPAFNAQAQAGRPIDRNVFSALFLPRYFTINGRSGFESAHAPDTAPQGRVGEPALIRVLNAGMAVHSPHIHGNHIYELANSGADGRVSVLDNVIERDTWTMSPLDCKDVLLPFQQPPDAYPWPPSDPREFPMRFPMHCHTEMSQTAAGGNYPQGAVTDWVIEGPLVA